MSGIVGIWNRDGAPVSPALLASLNRALAHRGPDGAHQWTDGAIGLACQLSRVTPESAAETQPLIHPLGLALVFDGRLDNRDEIVKHIHDVPNITAQSPDPELILALYQRCGERFVEHLTGDFALALYDPNRGTLLLARSTTSSPVAAFSLHPRSKRFWSTHTFPHGPTTTCWPATCSAAGRKIRA